MDTFFEVLESDGSAAEGHRKALRSTLKRRPYDQLGEQMAVAITIGVCRFRSALCADDRTRWRSEMTGGPDAGEEDAASRYRLSLVVGCENGAAGEVSERLGLEPERVLDGRKYRRGDTWVWEARVPPGRGTLAREIVAGFGVIAERADRIPEGLLETTVVSVSIFLDEAGVEFPHYGGQLRGAQYGSRRFETPDRPARFETSCQLRPSADR